MNFNRPCRNPQGRSLANEPGVIGAASHHPAAPKREWLKPVMPIKNLKSHTMSVLLVGIPPQQPFWSVVRGRRRIIEFTQEFLK
jgi:hypothetical protein